MKCNEVRLKDSTAHGQAYGFWPSFFSANAATAVYFKNASLYERDRPLFKRFVPVLRAINAAGWEPLRSAALVGGPRPEAGAVFVERFGRASRDGGGGASPGRACHVLRDSPNVNALNDR